MRVIFAIVLAMLLAGCATQPVVEPTEVWEGHFFSTNQVQEAIQKIQLKDKQSVWILSNTTLKRLLTNVKGE